MSDWHAVQLAEMPHVQGPQRQLLTPAIAEGAQLSVGYVVMPPGHNALPHSHLQYDIIIVVLEGNVLTLIGEELEEAFAHKPGDVMLIPAGIPHAGVNLSTENRVVLVECRADPMFNDDVKNLPHLEEVVEKAARYYQENFVEPSKTDTILELL